MTKEELDMFEDQLRALGGTFPNMKIKSLWRLIPTTDNGYDTYDSWIVVAETEVEARSINPNGNKKDYSNHCKPEDVSIERIGVTSSEFPSPIICASFNAG